MADRHLFDESDVERGDGCDDLGDLFVRLTGRTKLIDDQEGARSKGVIDATDPETGSPSESVVAVARHANLTDALEEPDDDRNNA